VTIITDHYNSVYIVTLYTVFIDNPVIIVHFSYLFSGFMLGSQTVM